MGRAPCCDKASVKKGPWSPEEDAKLKEFMDKFGTGGNWIALPQKAGLKRCGKSCRLRWLNYLRPNIKHGQFSDEEDKVICTLYATIGSRWSIIAAQLPGRTDNDIKNYWNTKLKKKLMGIIPSNIGKISQQFSNTFQQTQYHSLSIYNYAPQNHNLFSNNDNFPIIPSTESQYHQEGLMDLQHYYNGKENKMLMFGGNEGASCSSSDGSCGKDPVKREYGFVQNNYNGFEEESQKFMVNDHYGKGVVMMNGVMENGQFISGGTNFNDSSLLLSDEREMYYF